MSGLQPVQLYASRIPPGDFLIPAVPKHAATISVTMASIDPTEEPADTAEANQTRRSTLKVVRLPFDIDDSESDDSEDDEDYDDELDDDELSGDSDDELNGGPSDPKKSKKSKKQALLNGIDADDDEEDEDMANDDEESAKGLSEIQKALKAVKGKARESDSDEDEEDDDESMNFEPDEVVVCTLDPTQHYQQALNITVGEGEKVFFQVSGSHTIHLTGNYLMPASYGPSMYDEEDEDEYDLSPNEDELDGLDALIGAGSESDELDDIDDPRVEEVDSEEEAPPKLVKAAKNSKKRSAPSDDSDDEASAELEQALAEQVQKDLAAKAAKKDDVKTEPATNGDSKKLSKAEKKRQKKLKNNEGEAAPAPAAAPSTDSKSIKKDTQTNGSATSAEKKVQFAKNLEQGPSSSATKSTDTKASKLSNVQGITIDVREEGTGPAAHKGSRIEMRYIGKLSSGKVFDSNKSGKPFSFILGKGEVIKGWDLGLEGIKVGGQRRLVIPAKHAYGNKNMGDIPKGSELTFDVKCLTVK